MTRQALLIIAMMALTGCVTRTPRTSSDPHHLKSQILELQKIQGTQAALIDELNNKILLLKDQIGDRGYKAPAPVISKPTAPVASVPAPPPAVKASASGADHLWAQALRDMKKPTLHDLQKDVELLLKAYKNSPVTNNALYLLAHSYYERGQYDMAAQKFELLYKNFPDGNKAVASLFKLGLCYQKLRRPEEAREAFHNVVALYPGSVEASASEKYLKSDTAPELDQ